MPLTLPDVLMRADNIHRDELSRYFGELKRQVHTIRPDIRFLFVGFTNRCGSNYVCEALASSGVLNLGEEFYNAGTIIDNCRDRGLTSIGDFVSMLIEERGMNGWLVSKIAVEQLAVLVQIGLLDEILPRSHFILVERADKLGQAISLSIALQNDRWSIRQTPRIADIQLIYSRDEIYRILNYITDQNWMFDKLLSENGISAFSINYEQFVRMPQSTMSDLGNSLGIGGLLFVPNSLSLRPQRGAVNALWRERFLSDMQSTLRLVAG